MLDAHQHFWKIDRGDYGWMSPDLKPLYRDFGPDDLRPLLAAAGISRTVLVQAAETEAETDFLLGIAAETDFVAGVVGWIDMLSPEFSARLDHYVAQPKWIGLRPMLQEHDPALIRDPRFRDGLALVARRGVPFDILTHPRHLSEIVEAVRSTPGLHAILDHISKPEMTGPVDAGWAENIRALAAVPGMHCKISGLVTEAGPDWTPERIRPFFDVVADAFGPNRLVFGSDWPVCTLAARHDEVVDLARDLLARRFGPEETRAILETNGLRFYRLGDA
jgi:L-fuconolactonase